MVVQLNTEVLDRIFREVLLERPAGRKRERWRVFATEDEDEFQSHLCKAQDIYNKKLLKTVSRTCKAWRRSVLSMISSRTLGLNGQELDGWVAAVASLRPFSKLVMLEVLVHCGEKPFFPDNKKKKPAKKKLTRSKDDGADSFQAACQELATKMPNLLYLSVNISGDDTNFAPPTWRMIDMFEAFARAGISAAEGPRRGIRGIEVDNIGVRTLKQSLPYFADTLLRLKIGKNVKLTSDLSQTLGQALSTLSHLSLQGKYGTLNVCNLNVQPLLSRAPSLQSLDLYYAKDLSYKAVAEALGERSTEAPLLEVDIIKCDGPEDDLAPLITRHASTLRQLSVTNIDSNPVLLTALSLCTQLEDLSFYYAPSTTSLLQLTTLGELKTLTTGCSSGSAAVGWDGPAIQAMGRGMSALQKLSVSQFVGEVAWAMIPREMTSVRHLVVPFRSVAQISELAQSGADSIHTLEIFSTGSVFSSDDATLAPLEGFKALAKMRSLTVLSVCCSHSEVTDIAIAPFLSGAPSLKEFELSGWKEKVASGDISISLLQRLQRRGITISPSLQSQP